MTLFDELKKNSDSLEVPAFLHQTSVIIWFILLPLTWHKELNKCNYMTLTTRQGFIQTSHFVMLSLWSECRCHILQCCQSDWFKLILLLCAIIIFGIRTFFKICMKNIFLSKFWRSLLMLESAQFYESKLWFS